MKNFLLFSTLFASLLFVVNCAPNKSASNSATGVSANGVCPAGYYYSNGQCYYGTSSTSANGVYGNGFWADNHTGMTQLTIVNPTLMKQLYKYGMGVCDRGSNNYGAANCDYYIQGQTDIIIQFPQDGAATPSSAIVTVFAYPRQGSSIIQYQASTGPWWATLGNILLGGNYIPDPKYYSGAYRNPLQIQMSASPINNNAGFQASGYGDAWTGYNQTLITVEVLSGNVNTSNQLTYNLKIGGTTVATGRMARCQTLNCGM